MPEIQTTASGQTIYQPDGRTLAKFLEDPREVVIIQGPVGSGKSKAANMKVFMKALRQKRSRSGLRKTRWAVVRDCYDAETEILTERRGWVLFKDLIEGERVAQLNDGKLEWVVPTFYYAAPYVGEMIGFESEALNFRVTHDHKLHVSRRQGRAQVWQPYRLEPAHAVYGSLTARVRRNAGWDGIDPGYSVDAFEWLGLWFAEGSAGVYGNSPRCMLTQAKPDGIAYARGLFEKLGLPFSENARADSGINFRLRYLPQSRGLIHELVSAGRATEKTIPPWIMDAPPKHLRAFLKGFIAGDGYTGNGTTVAFTSSKRLADQLQEIALKAGTAAVISSRDRRGVKMVIGGVETAPTAIEYTVTFSQPNRLQPKLVALGKYRGWYKEFYNGIVYCVEVPTHVIYVRRKGKPFWCSQTYPELKNTTIRTWLDTFPEEIYGRFKWSIPYHQMITVGDVWMDVDFLALDREDDVKKLRSGEYTGFYVNELQYTIKALFDEMQSRAGRYPAVKDGGPDWHGIIADMNAPEEDHWTAIMTGQVEMPRGLSEEEIDALKLPPQWAHYMQPPGLLAVRDHDGRIRSYEPNPLAENIKWLPPNYYLNMVRGKTRSWIDSHIMNVVTVEIDGNPVWKNFNVETHVAEEVLHAAPNSGLVVGLDFGRQPAAIIGQSVNNRVIILDELIGNDESASIFAPKLKSLLTQKYEGKSVKFFGDPKGQDKTQSDERTAYDVFRTFGMTVAPAPVRGNNIKTRIDAVDYCLTQIIEGRPKLLISPTCRTLRMACQGKYHYAKNDENKIEPVKNRWSNPADALQYLVLGLGEGRAMIGLDLGSYPKHFVSQRRFGATRRIG